MTRRHCAVTSGSDRSSIANREEWCSIARIVHRRHWWTRQRRGVFVALIPGPKRERPLARSASFVVSPDTDTEAAAFRVLLDQLAEEDWELWHEPEVPLGIERINHGYWSWTLRRRAPGGVDGQLGRWRARSGGEQEMEVLRQRAIERLRHEGQPI